MVVELGAQVTNLRQQGADIKSYRIFGSNKAKVKVWQKILF